MDDLFVVTTNLPGPGAGPLAREMMGEIPDGWWGGPSREAITEAAVEGADKGCELVEVETADGRGRFRDAGIEWQQHPDESSSLYRLGPFASVTDRDLLLEAARRWAATSGFCEVCRSSAVQHEEGCPVALSEREVFDRSSHLPPGIIDPPVDEPPVAPRGLTREDVETQHASVRVLSAYFKSVKKRRAE